MLPVHSAQPVRCRPVALDLLGYELGHHRYCAPDRTPLVPASVARWFQPNGSHAANLSCFRQERASRHEVAHGDWDYWCRRALSPLAEVQNYPELIGFGRVSARSYSAVPNPTQYLGIWHPYLLLPPGPPTAFVRRTPFVRSASNVAKPPADLPARCADC